MAHAINSRAELIRTLRGEGYVYVRNLPDGNLVGVTQTIYTWRVNVALDETGSGGGVDFGTLEEAMDFCLGMQRIDDWPPAGWLADKRRCRPGKEHGGEGRPETFEEWLYGTES